MLGVNVEESPEKVIAWTQEHGITFPIVISDDGTVNPVFGLRAMPTTCEACPGNRKAKSAIYTPQRNRALPQVRPPPTPVIRSRSPFSSTPSSQASDRAMGMVAAVVLA